MAFNKTTLLTCLTLLITPFVSQAEDIADLFNRDDLPVLEPTPLMSQETMRVIEMLETIHFKSKEITDEAFDKLIDEYASRLDYNKLYFLQEDIDGFHNKYAQMLSFQLRHHGNLKTAFEIYEVYREIVLNRIEWTLAELEKDWSFEAEDSYIFDRSEEPWPKDREEADKLWTKRLKQELLQEILNEKTQEEAREHIAKRYKRHLRNIKEFGSSEVQEIFLTSMTQMFDPHSTFLSSTNFEDFNIAMRLSLVGIGALLTEEDGYCVIKELIVGGPAQRTTDLKPEDRIVAVAQGDDEPVDIVGMSIRKIVDQIRGEKGTTVKLTIIPGDAADESERRIVAIQRDTVKINSSRCTAHIHSIPLDSGDTMPIGVIDIPSFYGDQEMIDEDGNRILTSVTSDVEELVIKMRERGVQGIILDLRRNGGGLLEEAISMTGLFISRGPVVQVKDPYGKVYAHRDINAKVVYNGPLAVLTSRYSASASEIVAGALQNYGRALIIGNDSTHGKGTVQQVLMLDDYVLRKYLSKDKAGAAKLTVRKFYLPNGDSTQQMGVNSDITLPSLDEILAEGESELENALAWDQIKSAARFVERKMKDSFLEDLQRASESRQSQLDEFQFLAERMDWHQSNEDRTTISLNLEERKKRLEEDEAFFDRMKDVQRNLAELNFETEEIKLNSVLNDEEQNKEEELVAEAGIEKPAEVEDTLPEGGPTNPEGELALNDEKTTGDESEKEEEEEPVPSFDIQLRETLRIMVDAVNVSPNPDDWRQPVAPLASTNRFEKLIN